MPKDIYHHRATLLDGREVLLSEFAGQVLLIVNVASRCGLTHQYAALQELHRNYHQRGFAVLGFPCNQFGGQEPGTDDEIREFCTSNYGVTFPIFRKIEVNGENAHPLYRQLRDSQRGLINTTPIRWNFTKFLISRQGIPMRRFTPTSDPAGIAPEIEALLDE